MIFGRKLISQIVAGKKRQTRRPVREPHQAKRKNGTTYTTQPYTPKPGARIAVQPGRGQAASAHIIVKEARKELVGEITLKDALAEGFKTTDAFKAYWVQLYDANWATPKVPCPLCQGIGCHDCDEGEVVKPRDDAELVDRFEARHAETLVWVITFELDLEDRPLWLAPAARGPSATGEDSDDAHGYTENYSQSLRDAGEVDRPQLEAFAAAAREREELRASQDDPDLSARVARLLDAQAQGHDVSRQLAAIERAAQRGERRLPDAA